ncbi:hypothetical protein P7H22_20615 [Paenibacillus larvae]|nr:hypothetical protein [Paenibacillus larvae]MDT2242270.1 hypothetical protein [Paenibacillus larvae]
MPLISRILVVSIKPGGAIENATKLNVGYDKLDAVTSADIIGGTDPKTGIVTGAGTYQANLPRFPDGPRFAAGSWVL